MQMSMSVSVISSVGISKYFSVLILWARAWVWAGGGGEAGQTVVDLVVLGVSCFHRSSSSRKLKGVQLV